MADGSPTGTHDTPDIHGGIGRRTGIPRVVNTIDVEDLDAAILKVERNRGAMVVPKMAVPDVGWMAYFEDPEGNVHGMMQMKVDAA